MSGEVRRLRGIEKRYGSVRVLAGVDLVIAPGESVGILGANGSGKSTLLRILAGIARPTGGTVHGCPTTGYVPDRFPARQRMSARAYLCHMGRIRGLSTAAARTGAERWLDRLALADDPDTPLRELSKGNAQKVGLAQALLVAPQLLVLDEPWSGLDTDTRQVLGEVIEDVRRDRTSVVFTDHRADVVRTSATTAHRLMGGVLTELADQAAVVRIVLREPDDAGKDRRGQEWQHEEVLHVDRCDGEVRLTVREPGREAVLLSAIRSGCSILAVHSGHGAAGEARS